MSKGEYVQEKTIGKISDQLWSDEAVEFIAKGNNVEVKYRGTSDSLDNTKGWPRMVATDQRVFIKVPKLLNTKTESFDYSELEAADIGSSGITGTEIKLRTVRGKTYTFRADEPDDTELEEMVEFIRSQITGEPTEVKPSSTATSTSTPSDRSDLHKTESCVECGESVSDGVNRCPNCGFNPNDHKTWFYIHIVLAGISGATIVGLLIVPFFAWKGRKHRQKHRGGVTG